MIRWAALIAAASVAIVLYAQQNRAPEARVGASKIETLHVQGNVYLLTGAGGNIAVQVGEQTVVLVDSGLPEYSAEVRAAIRKLSSKPVGYIINTSIDRDHTGGNENLAKGGIYMLQSANQQRPQSAVIGHLNLLNRLTDADGKALGIASAGFPVDTYDTGDWKLYANDEALMLEHPASAHTDADTTVYFRRSDVLAAGDLFDMTRFPVIDEQRGGSINGILKTLNHISIDIAVPKENEEGGTYIIPGHGRVGDRYDVANYRDMLTIIRDRIADGVKKGLTLEQVKATKPAYDYEGGFGVESGPWTTSMFIEAVYRELGKKGK
jgi:glyoxylase-like metal-dependent hydrolase (beta-lactamase superfamily II)